MGPIPFLTRLAVRRPREGATHIAAASTEARKQSSLLSKIITVTPVTVIILPQWTLADLNRSPLPCHGSALPNELRARADRV